MLRDCDDWVRSIDTMRSKLTLIFLGVESCGFQRTVEFFFNITRQTVKKTSALLSAYGRMT